MRLSAFLLAPLLVAGCTLDTDYFGEYRGVNLLENWDFGSGRWALDVGDEFMTWEPVPGEAHEGHPGYRLEIKNLVPNGDFEDEAITPDSAPSNAVPTNWSLTGGTVEYGASHDSVSLTGRALRWKASAGGNALLLNLGTALGSAWVPSTSYPYRVRFDFADLGSSGILNINLVKEFPHPLGDGSLAEGEGKWDQTNLVGKTVYSFSKQFTQPSNLEDRYLVWGPLNGAEATNVVLDNVRVFLDAGSRAATATLPSLDSGTLTLLPGEKTGMYQFTVWVKDDPGAGDNNRFQAAAVSITLRAAVKSGTGSPSPGVFQRPAGGWSDWTPLTMDFGFDFVGSDVDLGGQPALTVSLSPMELGTDVESADVGSLLVSHPTLTFNP